MKLAAQSEFMIEKFGAVEGMKRLKDLGYEAVTYTVPYDYLHPFTTEWTDEEMKKQFSPIGEACAAVGLPVLYTEPKSSLLVDPASQEGRKLHCVQTVKAAAAMGCKTVTVPMIKNRKLADGVFENSKEAIYDIADAVKAEADGKKISINFVNATRGASRYPYGCRASEILEISRHYNAGIVLDPVNAYFAGERLDEILDACRDQMAAFVISDVELSSKMARYPMLGALDYSVLLPRLAAIPDDSWAVMKTDPFFNRYIQFADDPEVVEHLSKYLFDLGKTVIGKSVEE